MIENDVRFQVMTFFIILEVSKEFLTQTHNTKKLDMSMNVEASVGWYVLCLTRCKRYMNHRQTGL